MDINISIQALEYIVAGLCGITAILSIVWLVSIVIRLHMEERMESGKRGHVHLTSKDIGKKGD